MLEAFSLLICCWKAEWGPDAGIFITFIGLALEYGNKLGLALKKGKQIWLLFCIKRKHKGNSVQEACTKGFAVHIGIKRSIFQIFWKPHCVTKSLFYELETSNFCYLLIFWICWAVLSFSKIGHHWYQTFYKGPSFEFLVDWKIKKHQRGEPYKMSNVNVVQSCRNFVQLSKIKK